MEGFKNWEFMTIHCWGERAAGDWVLEVYDTPSQLRNFKTPGKKSVQINSLVEEND